MLHIGIQILTLFSGLLINFLIPMLFGIEEYGLFIKANILVFLFQKLMDVISEPLISNVEKNQLFPVAFAIGTLLLTGFLGVNCFFSAGSPWLLGSMYWSNCLLLVLYALNMPKLILAYLIAFIVLFTTLLSAVFFNVIDLSITHVCGITNVVPASFCLIYLLVTQKMPLSVSGLYANISRMILLIPKLFSLTLVNNLFTNILPFYLSFVVSPQLLGLFRVQVSIVQSVVAIFPMNSKALSTHFAAARDQYHNEFIKNILVFSVNYFYIIALIGYIFVRFNGGTSDFAAVFFLLPIVHSAVILERYMLGLSMRRPLVIINLLISTIACIVATHVHSIAEMVLLYASGISTYLLLMLLCTPVFQFKVLLRLMAILTPLFVLLAIDSFAVGLSLLSCSAIMVFIFAPLNRKSLSVLMR